MPPSASNVFITPCSRRINLEVFGHVTFSARTRQSVFFTDLRYTPIIKYSFHFFFLSILKSYINLFEINF